MKNDENHMLHILWWTFGTCSKLHVAGNKRHQLRWLKVQIDSWTHIWGCDVMKKRFVKKKKMHAWKCNNRFMEVFVVI